MTYVLPNDFQKITAQRIFNAAWQAFIVEGKPPAAAAVDAGYGPDDKLKLTPSCRYLTDDGRKCAVGLLIPDGHPAQKAWRQVDSLRRQPDAEDLFEPGELSLRYLQTGLHDSLCEVRDGIVVWSLSLAARKLAYQRIAAENDLKIPE